MKKLVWKLVWFIVCKWRRVANRYKLLDQVKELDEIKIRLVHYRKAMEEKGIWK